jgi:glycosyltransferase involved in cell wall biosynthesis
VREHLQRADVMLLPTLADSMARAVMEALACGLPVITTETSGFARLGAHGEDMFFVPVRDVDETAALLTMLAGDEELRDRIRLAARKLAETLSWERYRERARSVLDDQLPGLIAGGT